MKIFSKSLIAISLTMALVACGGGGSDSSSTSNVLSASASSGKSNSSNNVNSNVSTEVTCNKGIPSNLPKLNNTGIFNEVLYRYEYEYPNYDYKGAAKIYINLYAFSLVDGIQYENISTINDFGIDQNQFVYASNTYFFNSTNMYTRHSISLTNLGWPSSYITNVTSNGFESASYNDQCDLNVNKQETNLIKVDLSGLPVNEVLQKSQIEGNNGFKYLSNDMGYFLNAVISSPVSDNKKAYEKFSTSTATFPVGSYVYLPLKVNIESNFYSFDTNSKTTLSNLEEWSDYSYYNHLYTWKPEKMAGYDVLSAYNADGTPYLEIDFPINYNGDIYYVYEILAGDKIANGESTGHSALFNKTAIDALTAQIKTYYLK